jgi:hypothetical protein
MWDSMSRVSVFEGVIWKYCGLREYYNLCKNVCLEWFHVKRAVDKKWAPPKKLIWLLGVAWNSRVQFMKTILCMLYIINEILHCCAEICPPDIYWIISRSCMETLFISFFCESSQFSVEYRFCCEFSSLSTYWAVIKKVMLPTMGVGVSVLISTKENTECQKLLLNRSWCGGGGRLDSKTNINFQKHVTIFVMKNGKEY